MKKSSIAVFFACMFVITGWGQEPWSLKKCIDYGLENHLSAQISQQGVVKARQQALEGIAGYLPQVNGSFSIDDNLKRQTQIIPAGIFGPDPVQVQFGTQFNSSAMLQVDQTIYDQSLISGLTANKPNVELAEMSVEQNEETLMYNISSAYFAVFVYVEQVDLLKENISKYENLLEIVKLQEANGVAKKIDVDRVSVTLSITRSQLSIAESNRDLSVNRLKNAMGYSLADTLVLPGSIATEILDNYAVSQNVDIKTRLDYQLQAMSVNLLRIDKERTYMGYVPKISGYVRYGAQAMGNNFADSYNNWFDYSTIGIKVSVPIFDGLRMYARGRQAGVSYLNASYNLELSEDAYQLQYDNARLQLIRSLNNLDNDRMNVELAKEVFDNTSLQYAEGTTTLSDLLNAETMYKEAESNYIQSLIGYYQAILDQEKSAGTIRTFYQKLN